MAAMEETSPPAAAGALVPAAAAAGGHLSVAWLRKHWYVLCESKELRTRPLKRFLMGTPLVLFRDSSGKPGALLDRCPHRNVPLSLGQVVGEQLECAYHGWTFDTEGRCGAVPGLCGEADGAARRVPAYAAMEQDGYVWVYATADEVPENEPYRLRTFGEKGYTTVRRTVEFEASLHASIENALDVPHTAFLHRGLFRGGREPVEITAVVTRSPTSAQVEFLGEPRPPGLAARLLSPSGGIVTHFDRFYLPSIAEVEYRIGDENHIVTTSLCTPVGPFLTRIFATVSLRMRLPGWLVKPFVFPLAMKIFKQDAWILKEQTEALERFGGERFSSTEIDLIGGQVWRLLRREEQGRRPEPDDWRKEIRLRV